MFGNRQRPKLGQTMALLREMAAHVIRIVGTIAGLVPLAERILRNALWWLNNGFDVRVDLLKNPAVEAALSKLLGRPISGEILIKIRPNVPPKTRKPSRR